MAKTIFKQKFYKWWLSVLLIATATFWSVYTGFVTKIWATDITMLTSVIAVMFIAANIRLGWITYHLDTGNISKKKLESGTDSLWFISEILMAIGMLGTVIGLVHMLAVNFIDGGVQGTEQLQGILGNMWNSMGLALYTNVVGLATSIVLKLQVHFIVGDSGDET